MPVDPQMLAQILGGGGGGAPPQPGGGDEGSYSGGNPLGSVQKCIQDLHGLMAEVPGANHSQLVLQALGPLMKIQAELMQPKQQVG